MSSANNLYYEEIRLSAIGRLAVGMLVVALVFVALIFIDPFTVSNKGDSQSGIFWVPASLFLGLAWFAWFMGKFTIIATEKRLNVVAGMNSNSITWQEIGSAGEDYSHRSPCNVLTTVPTLLDGESAMVYCIGRLPRIEVHLKNDRLRRIIFPTRQPDVLLKIIQEKARKARGIPVTIEKEELEMVSSNVFDIPDPFGQIGGPPPFPLP